ncbi:hypothetical protein PHIN9_13270 [Polynucleobacter sp. HIN9]|nr:hypothetical protein PHIN9_13270 [Polynucleobacter sp. HIN9]
MTHTDFNLTTTGFAVCFGHGICCECDVFTDDIDLTTGAVLAFAIGTHLARLGDVGSHQFNDAAIVHHIT